MPPPCKLEGKRFGRLTVIEKIDGRVGVSTWRCACDCGRIIKTESGPLNSGNTSSCGCARVESLARSNVKLKKTHGMTGTRLMSIYSGMIQRCRNKNHDRWERYGGRGIAVCDEWLNDRAVFFKWAMNNGYRDGLEIDRIDNDGGYNSSNCRFITRALQAKNRTTTILIEFDGKTQCLSDWAKECNIKVTTLYHRIFIAKIPIEHALRVPVGSDLLKRNGWHESKLSAIIRGNEAG